MRLIKIFSCLSLIFFSASSIAQLPTIQLMQSGNRISLRGLSVVDAQTIWASGNNGMVAKSVDGGSHFEWIKVTGYEKRDFRDIEGFDKNTAVIMGVDAPAIILRTTDGGQHWQKVFEDTTKGMFLDAMDFSDNNHGIVIGDPINGNAYLASTTNGGINWQKLTTPSIPVNEGEAFFASSGS
ncbi:MAG: oxidoreductase, partial [Bacteroidetes bacterium]|nr:oxidoreductase [Bacteroidota bacterium]